jgi:hypothetical protein
MHSTCPVSPPESVKSKSKSRHSMNVSIPRCFAFVFALVGCASEKPLAPITVASVEIVAASTTMQAGQTQQLTAVVKGTNGGTLTDRTVTWSSSDPSVAKVSATGLVTAGSVLGGTAASVAITAIAEGTAGTSTLSINPVPVTRIEINNDSLMIRVGDSLRLNVSVVGASGDELTGRDLKWKSVDSTIARVSPTGMVTAPINSGARYRSTRLVVTHQQISDTAVIVAQPLVPLLTLTTTDTLVRIGQSATLRWTSQYAITCQGTGLVHLASGPSGAVVIRPDSGGRRWTNVTCTGDGGTVSDSIKVITPFLTYLNSHDNEKAYVITTRQLTATTTDPIPVCGSDRMPVGNARAYADFLQNGTITLVANPLRYFTTGAIPTPGPICFLSKNTNGTWTDITTSLIDDTVGCVHSRRALISDLNGDRKPDVFIACHGAEGPKFPSLPGESSIYLLSTPTGKYRKTTLPYTAYSHGASVGDINKDGFPDILLLHASIPSSPNPYVAVLMNNGDGSFTRDDGRLPVELRHNPYTAELLDVNGDGNLDALISSYDDVSPDGPPPTRIFWGKNGGIFDTTHPQLLPQNLLCRSTLHLTKHLNNLYALRVCDGYTNNIVQRIQIGTWKDQIVWNEPAPYLGWGSGPFGWLDWLNFDNGQFIHDRVPGVRIKP